jgi:tetratricopeptide (TPR) repeat protein
MKPSRQDPHASSERTRPPLPGRWEKWLAKWAAFDLRERWWGLLDLLEARRGLRRTLYATLALLLLLGAACFWGYPWWTKRSAILMAEKWLEAGKLAYAADALQQAIKIAPEEPRAWQLAAKLEWRQGLAAQAVEHAHRAATAGKGRPDLILEWASYALRADLPAEAEKALATLPAADVVQSALAQRILGELARRKDDLTSAKNHFETALRLDGPAAANEVPLGVVVLNSVDNDERQHGLDLLTKWTDDQEWGPTALRSLLTDALVRNDRQAMLKWAEKLRAHPRCLTGDIPNCLQAISRADPARFNAVIAEMENDHAVTPQAAVELLSWLNQIGRSDEAVRWMKTLPQPAMHQPPLVAAGAEALRATGDWTGLKAWTEAGDWGPDIDFLRWAYGLQAARMLGDEKRVGELWRTLYEHAQLNGAHALFAGSTIYSWGRTTEAEALWWRAAEQEGKIAIDALGSLARHYQVRRDADGQYRVFRRLHLLQPQDAAVGNNFVFFAALLGRERQLAGKIARENASASPQNPTYLATCAFVLTTEGRAHEALALLKPVAADADKSSALAFAYGLALANTGRKEEAAKYLSLLDPATLTAPEQEMIKSALDGQ